MSLLDLIFPKRCVGCNKLGKYFCIECIAKIEWTIHQICPVCEKAAIDGATHPKCRSKYSLDGLTNFFRYRGIIRQAIKSVKYRFISDVALEFINLIPSELLFLTMKQCSNETILVPVPLHPSRLRFRGFNQTEILGRIVAKRLKIPLRTDLLERIRKSVPQVEMKDRKERLRNMDKVFSVNNVTMKQINYVILFDDVFTTGATLRAAANVLKRTGANSVWGITLAHG